MRKFLTLGAAVAVLCAIAVSAPANAAARKTDGIHNGQAAAQTFSARRRHRHYRHYSYRYYRPYYYRRHYYAYPYGYAYSPYYRYRHYYRRPGIYFGFGF